ncbi:hypothetical protein A2U01_0099363, partial [Trifolium medium]|nr:hypothetical protein [Trifolium medium]
MGKNPMTRTQWRRFQRQKKQDNQKTLNEGKVVAVNKIELAKRPVRERITPLNPTPKVDDDGADDIMDDDLLDSEP